MYQAKFPPESPFFNGDSGGKYRAFDITLMQVSRALKRLKMCHQFDYDLVVVGSSWDSIRRGIEIFLIV